MCAVTGRAGGGGCRGRFLDPGVILIGMEGGKCENWKVRVGEDRKCIH